MDLIDISRVLWRHRLWVGGSAVVALLIGVFLGYHVSFTPLPQLQTRQYEVGQATVHVLVDTPSSQVADLEPPIGTDALIQRASLFANLMATGPVQARIAANAGIPVSRLDVIAPSTTSPLIPTPLANQAGKAGASAADYVLTVRSDETLPLITMDAQAPTALGAARLANGSFSALREQVAHVAGEQKIPAKRRPVVSALGGAASGDVGRGPRLMYALLASVFAFVLACSTIVIVDGLVRRLRTPARPAADAAGGREGARTNGFVPDVDRIPPRVSIRG